MSNKAQKVYPTNEPPRFYWELWRDPGQKYIPYFWEELTAQAMIFFLFMGVVGGLALLWPADLAPRANVLVTPPGIKPEWYFLGLFQLIKIVPELAGLAGQFGHDLDELEEPQKVPLGLDARGRHEDVGARRQVGRPQQRQAADHTQDQEEDHRLGGQLLPEVWDVLLPRVAPQIPVETGRLVGGVDPLPHQRAAPFLLGSVARPWEE